MAASLLLVTSGSSLVASPAAAAGAKVPCKPAIGFPAGAGVAAGGQIAVRFDAKGDAKVTRFRYSVGSTTLDKEVLAAADRTATVLVDAGDVTGDRLVYAVAVDRRGRVSPMTQGSFTVSATWSLQGRAIDATTWMPVEGATIRLEPAGIEMVTGPDGAFQFVADPGLYTVTGTFVGPPGLSGSSPELQLDGQGLNFELYMFPDSEQDPDSGSEG
ncbi:hypothetical protein [Actinoplanes sp. NPDC051859]|uniref:hypothetical protein n=1 Tax=Actinoplanes sp. NPDC051859 TaxID=3363909 RepID=UPI00378AD25E